MKQPLLALIGLFLFILPPAAQGDITQGRTVAEVESGVDTYLNTRDDRSVLTPGEYVEWKLDLKAGQVVIAGSRSDSFSPILQVLDAKQKVLLENDGRYPGDQRPLLLWRCDKDGAYLLHVRAQHDRFGGECFTRYAIYDSFDLPANGDAMVRRADGTTAILLRMSMRAGEIREVGLSHVSEDDTGQTGQIEEFIGPEGLPDPSLVQRIQPAAADPLIYAPVSGDYYAFCAIGPSDTKVRAFSHPIEAKPLQPGGPSPTATSATRRPTLWTLPVQAGQVLRISLSGLKPDCHMDLMEALDPSQFSLQKADQNPFYPKPAEDLATAPPLLYHSLPGRSRDNRVAVIAVMRDGALWISSNGDGPPGEFSISVTPATTDLPMDHSVQSTLPIGSEEYWQFDARVGDVMSFRSASTAFALQSTLRDPDMSMLMSDNTPPDATSLVQKFVLQKPGRYILGISSIGSGGGGAYSLTRNVIHPQEVSAGKPAQSEIADRELQVWRFTIDPGKPMLLHWTSSAWNFGISTTDEHGDALDLRLKSMSPKDKFGILSATRPTTYLVVLTGGGPRASYSFSLSPLATAPPKH